MKKNIVTVLHKIHQMDLEDRAERKSGKLKRGG